MMRGVRAAVWCAVLLLAVSGTIFAQYELPKRLLRRTEWVMRIGPAEHAYRVSEYGAERFQIDTGRDTCWWNPTAFAFRVEAKCGIQPVTSTFSLSVCIAFATRDSVVAALASGGVWRGRTPLLASSPPGIGGGAGEWCNIRSGPEMECRGFDAMITTLVLTEVRRYGRWVMVTGQVIGDGAMGLDPNGPDGFSGTFQMPMPITWLAL